MCLLSVVLSWCIIISSSIGTIIIIIGLLLSCVFIAALLNHHLGRRVGGAIEDRGDPDFLESSKQYICMYIYIYTHTYTYIYVYIYIYNYNCYHYYYYYQ